MIKLSIPSFYKQFYYMKDLLEYYYSTPDQFYQDRIIDSCYDTCGLSIWGGGRIILNSELTMGEIINYYNNYPQIKLRHVFTNCLITDQIINDYLMNKFVKDYIRPQDEVILNNLLLIKHFQNSYPNIPIIYSTTLNITNIEQVNQLSTDHIYVLNYNYNNNDNYLKQLTHKENIEILCAEPCIPNCPNRLNHYTSLSKQLLRIPLEDSDIRNCPYNSESKVFSEIMKLPHAITNERIKKLEQQGFQYFKISGRTLTPPLWLETILYYLALPEYRDYIRQYFLQRWW